MKRAALYVKGRVIVADSHLSAFQSLTIEERTEYIVSGFLNENTGEFDSDLAKDHFFNKEIYLIRHGEIADSNEEDPPISTEGVKQAKQVAESLKDIDLSGFTCFTSPLLRCLQTSEVLSQICGVKVNINFALMESPHFLSENETYHLKNRHKEFSDFDWPTNIDWLIPYETPSKFIIRIKNALQNLPQKSIIISHFGIITNMAKLALCDEKAAESGVPTASLTHIDNQKVKCLGQTYRNTMEGYLNENENRY